MSDDERHFRLSTRAPQSPTLSYLRWMGSDTLRHDEEQQSTEPEHPFAVGTRIEDRYLLEDILGSGGMGHVYLAHDAKLDRRVAIKVIRRQVGQIDLNSMLQAEARLGANLHHPNVATVHDFGVVDEHSYTVFEYVDGQTLRRIMHKRQSLPLSEVQPIVAQLASALDHVHARGVVHRDLKPENICSTADGQFKILDLGLAHELSRDENVGSYSGTPAYSSPEQAGCQPISGRSDQYSLALIIYELLTGTRPFKALMPSDMLLQQIRTPAPDPRQRCEGLPDHCAEALLQALAKNPEERFPTCQAFASAMGCNTAVAVPLIAVEQTRRIGFYICYAPEQSILASKIARAIDRAGYSCWLYQRDALPGVALHQQIKTALTRCQGMVLLLSREFEQHAGLVEEIAMAHHLGRVFFPLLVEMSQEEFDARSFSWRPMLGPSGLAPISRRDQVDDVAARLLEGARSVGILPNEDVAAAAAQIGSEPAQRPSRIWATDANQIDIDDLDRVVYRTDVINDYLRRRNKMFLSASKGLGKTLLLSYKRHQLMQEEGQKTLITIPEGRPYLDLMSELRSLSERFHKPLSQLNTTTRLWNMSLRIAILSHHAYLISDDERDELQVFPPRIGRWLKGTKIQPTLVFKELTSLAVSELNRLVDETEVYLDQKMRSVHSGTCVFVDKVDQAIRQLPRQAWINVQAGLIEAAWELMNSNSHLRIFATIREEAFSNYESDVKSNLIGATTRLQYSEDDLAEMLDQLTTCYEGRDGFREFVGLNVLRHPWRPDPEDSYSFVRRHTLGRPRDLVAMASEISATQNSLSEDRFRTMVFQTSATSLVSNIFDEVGVFLTCLQGREQRQHFLSLISHNILSRDDAISICEQFNGLEPGTIQSLGANSSYIHHPFQDLYLAGLLGVIERDQDTGLMLQRFRQPHDMFQDVGFDLPDSDFFLIHPALNNYIAQHRQGSPYFVFQQITVGHRELWQPFFHIFYQVECQIARQEPEAITTAQRLLSKAHRTIELNREQLPALFSESSDEWRYLLKSSPGTDELVYWFEELSEVSAVPQDSKYDESSR